MSGRNTFFRSLHDLGLAAWFGGSLMGATGVNGAASQAADPRERLQLANSGWARWAPWEVAAVAAHTIGGIGVIVGNRTRHRNQPGARSLTAAKLALTIAAGGATAYAGVLGLRVHRHEDEGAEGATEPGSSTGPELESAQRQLKLIQAIMPALTGAALVLNAVHGEQQRGAYGLLDYAVNAGRSEARSQARKIKKAVQH